MSDDVLWNERLLAKEIVALKAELEKEKDLHREASKAAHHWQEVATNAQEEVVSLRAQDGPLITALSAYEDHARLRTELGEAKDEIASIRAHDDPMIKALHEGQDKLREKLEKVTTALLERFYQYTVIGKDDPDASFARMAAKHISNILEEIVGVAIYEPGGKPPTGATK